MKFPKILNTPPQNLQMVDLVWASAKKLDFNPSNQPRIGLQHFMWLTLQYGSIHLQAEIAFQAGIFGLEFWPVFQAEISGLCDYKCSSSSNLQKHKRIHIGDKPFSCIPV